MIAARITIERDTGTVEVASGLTGDEQIIKIAVPTLAWSRSSSRSKLAKA